jgi:1-acyl-sn-glycerol-3-phosphate acyltransferase
MPSIAHRLLVPLGRFFVSLRYDIDVQHDQNLDTDSLNNGPVLILPNHPSYLDPVLVMASLPLMELPRPLVFSGTYRHAAMYPFLKAVNAFEVPWSDKPNREVYKASQEVLDRSADALNNGQHILLYPSGKLQRQGHEIVGAARGAYDLVQRCPDAKILLVRTRGIWGSRFCCQRTGGVPNLTRTLWFAFFTMCASLFFFLPKRRVTMFMQEIKRDDLPLHDKRAFNAFLDSFYNAEGPEPVSRVPYHHLHKVPRADQQFASLLPINAPSAELSSLSSMSLQPAEATHA